MNIIETFVVNVVEPTNDDGRWLFVDADPTAGVQINTTGRTAPMDVTALRTLKAIVNHLLVATEATETSVLAAVAAEFA